MSADLEQRISDLEKCIETLNDENKQRFNQIMKLGNEVRHFRRCQLLREAMISKHISLKLGAIIKLAGLSDETIKQDIQSEVKNLEEVFKFGREQNEKMFAKICKDLDGGGPSEYPGEWVHVDKILMGVSNESGQIGG